MTVNTLRGLMEWVGLTFDAVGVLVVTIGALVATRHAWRNARAHSADLYRGFRQDLGRAIVLGLEFLVAGDIIRTVVVDPSLENVAVLGLIVLIRTFLSMALQLEIESRWPWEASARVRSDAGS
jgi:uncharacterized membrane protein